MEETNTIIEAHEHLTRQELFDLHKHYEASFKEYLGLCYQYLNFYIGLLSAFLTGTIVGLLSIKYGDIRGLALLIGSLLTVAFARIGYLTVKIFYRRFVEDRVVVINIDAMLQIRRSQPLDLGNYKPLYPSQENGFLPVVDRTVIENIHSKAKSENWRAEKVVEEIAKVGDTLANARHTFIAFGLAGIVPAVFIILTAFPNLI